MNSAFSRSIGTTPFEILFGKKMRLNNDPELFDLIQQGRYDVFQEERLSLRNETKKNIAKIQTENCLTYNRRRTKATKYQLGDIVAIR